jgi:hypothetical protein
VEHEYYYKKGKWIFWDRLGNKIAEGTFSLNKVIEHNYGGCDYEFIESTINTSDWKFWDSQGKIIEPNNSLILSLETCTPMLVAR